MPNPWPKYLAEFASILARPRSSWSESETVSVWNSLAIGTVSGALLKYAYRKLWNWADAEEVLQTCLLELSASRTYDPKGDGPEAFRKWVYGCLYNHVCRFFRLHAKEREFSVTAIGPNDNGPGDSSDKGRGARQIERALDERTLLDVVGSLPPKPREAVTRRLRGESDAQIGLAMGLTPVNVRQIVSRATRDIRKRFGISNLPAS
jgi:RNA polymerase sigma factor (sigma-70 family)